MTQALRETRALPSAIALGKELSAYPFTAKTSLPSAAYRALGKGFSECHDGTRQRKAAVTAPLPSATRRHSAKKCVFYFLKKMLCRVPASGTWQSLFSFFFGFSLPSVVGRHSAKQFFLIFYAECLDHGTRQSWEA